MKNRLSILVFILSTIFFVSSCVKNPITNMSSSEQTSESASNSVDNNKYTVEYPNVEEYFEEKSEIKAVTSVKDYDGTLTEQETCKELKERGFTDYAITTEYSLDGHFYDAVEISESSQNKHPMYQTYYVNSNNEIWNIFVIGDSIVATPISYNLQYPNEINITIAESNELISYDSSTNSYYRTVPKENIMDVRIVDKINAKTLDSLTVEVLYND